MLPSIIKDLLPLMIALGTVIFTSAFIYFAIRYLAAQRKFPLRARFDFLWAIGTLLILFNTGAGFFPFEGSVAPLALSWSAFAAFLIFIYLLMFLIDQFVVEYFLVSILKIYCSPPIRKVVVMLVLALAMIVGVQLIFDINPWAIYAPTSLLSLGAGIALKDSFQMFFSGISISRVVYIGDWIRIGQHEGQVLDIDWARTVLRTHEGNRVYIPNNELQKQIFVNFNMQEKRVRCQVEVAASYSDEPEKVRQILLSCVQQGGEGILQDPEPQAYLKEYSDFSVNYVLHFWVDEYSNRQERTSLMSEKVLHAFKREGIVIPFPTYTVYTHRG